MIRQNVNVCLSTLLLFGMLCLQGGARAQAPTGLSAEKREVEEALHGVAQAFIDKDGVAVKQSFADNFAGPFRLPKLARGMLDRILGGAETVTADFDIDEIHTMLDRAVVTTDLNMRFQFPGGGKQEVKGPFLLTLYKEPAGWQIAGAERVATDWSIGENETEIQWSAEGMSFAIPKEWGTFPIRAAEARKSVAMISPDLGCTISVAVVEFPIPVTLDALVANHKAIPSLFPGSTFLGDKRGELAGEPAVLTRVDIAMGSRQVRLTTMMMIRGNQLIVVSNAVTPPENVSKYMEQVRGVRSSLKLTKVVDSQTATQVLKGYSNTRLGVDFPVPDGWILQPLPEDTTRKRGWAFAVHMRPPEGDSFILIGGRELPAAVDMDVLQKAEMDNLKMVEANVTIQNQLDLKVSGFPARSWSFALALGQARQRREVFVLRKTLLIFVIADAIPPTDFPRLSKAVDTLLKTVRLVDI